MLGFRLSLLPILFAGCASGLLVVPDADWQQVPPAQRAALDRQYAADLAAARAEDAAAKASLAELRHAPPPAAEARPPAVASADPDDAEWAEAVARYDKASTAARTKVDAARAAAAHADLAWREARVEAAAAQLDVIVRERELKRARAIDHNLLGTDTYDAAPLRGQMSEAQKRWYAASTRAHHARGDYEHAVAALSTAKESYAQLMRGGPGHDPMEAPPSTEADLPKPHFELTGWAVTRRDITRRRGLRHYLEQAAASPAQLRWVSPRFAVRKLPVATSTTIGPQAPVPAQPAAAPAKPAAAKPAVTTAAAAPTTKTDASAPASTRPADPTAAIATSARPAPATRPTQAAKPTDNAAAAMAAGVKPAAAPTASASAKPVEP